MWSIKRLLKDRKGFTLMELICVICIGSILVGICCSMLTLSQRSNVFAEDTDDLLYNGNFALEYIKYDIKKADKIIIASDVPDLNTKYPNNIGFVIMEHQPEYPGSSKYIYATFVIENGSLWRRASRFDSEYGINAVSLTVNNEICGNIKSFGDTLLDWANGILYLDLNIGKSNFLKEFKTTISLDCDLVY